MNTEQRLSKIRTLTQELAKGSAKTSQPAPPKYVSGKLELKGNVVTHFKFIEAIQNEQVTPHRSTLMSKVNDYFGLYTKGEKVAYYTAVAFFLALDVVAFAIVF